MNRYRCPGCGYVFDEAEGDAHEGYAPGTLFENLPEDFCCPDCSVREKQEFEREAQPADDEPEGR